LVEWISNWNMSNFSSNNFDSNSKIRCWLRVGERFVGWMNAVPRCDFDHCELCGMCLRCIRCDCKLWIKVLDSESDVYHIAFEYETGYELYDEDRKQGIKKKSE